MCTYSLVPRLPRSGTQTLKLCRCGEPGIFSRMRSAKGREGIERPSLSVGVPETQNRKKSEGIYLVIGGLNIIHTER